LQAKSLNSSHVRLQGVRLAVQLYTLRHRLTEDLEGTLGALAEAGAREVELAGLYERDASELRRILDAAGLSACSAHVPLERFERELEAVLEEARALGVETLIVPSVPAPASAEAADELVARLLAARATVTDFGFAYHNHHFEFGEVDLWSRLVAAGLDLEPDVGWLRVAGRDPVAVLGELAGRIPLVHAKDVRRANGGWEDVVAGDGELDWAAIARAAEAGGARHLVVELDNPSDDPVDDAARSLATLREVAS
jgi:sugar phosphate isomerase/epimerase